MDIRRSFLRRLLFAMSTLPSTALFAQPSSASSTAVVAKLKVAPGVGVQVWATELRGPRGLTVDARGILWVAEESGGAVTKIGPDRRPVRAFTGMQSPHDVALDAKGRIFVAEPPTGRILVLVHGQAPKTYVKGLVSPVDLAFAPNGDLLVCELVGARVTAFDKKLNTRIVVQGFRPHGLAFGSAGTVYVNDTSGRRVVKVLVNGAVEVLATDLDGPIGLAIGPSGDVFVAERGAGRLLRFTPGGARSTVLEGLTTPRDPAFDGQGNLYLAETDAGRVLKLSGSF